MYDLRFMTMKRILAAVVVGLIMLVPQGCRISYKLNGAAIDYNVYKTIHLLDYITRNTRLAVTDGASDLELEGEITGYNLTPQAVTEDAYASKTRLTITVRVKYTDTKQEGKDVSQTFSAYRDFDSSQMLNDVQEQLCQEISKELVDLIFNATLGNW